MAQILSNSCPHCFVKANTTYLRSGYLRFDSIPFEVVKKRFIATNIVKSFWSKKREGFEKKKKSVDKRKNGVIFELCKITITGSQLGHTGQSSQKTRGLFGEPLKRLARIISLLSERDTPEE